MWNTLIVDPMTNALMFIYSLVGGNFGLAIILFTILVRLVTHPLTASQLKSTKALQDLQKSKKWEDMQKKYKNDREKMSQEQMKLYQEAGVNPFGSCLPTFIQFPIIIGLYQAIIAALAATPLQLITFSRSIYNQSAIAEIIPINSTFLWMDLASPERLDILGFGVPVLAILVVITSYLQTKMMTPMSTGSGEQGAMMGRMMSIYFPLFIGYLTMTYASGLGVYFVASNIFGIIQQASLGRLNWRNVIPGAKKDDPAPTKGSKKAITKKNPPKKSGKNPNPKQKKA